jgi:methyl-accepting chemotaxis protein
MKNFFASLQLWKKFALLGLIGVALFVVPTTFYIISAESVIAHKTQEISGVVPARTLLHIVQLIQQHRGMSAVMISGNSSIAAERQGKAGEIDREIQALQEQLRVRRNTDERLSKEIAAQQNDWKNLRDSIDAGKITGLQSFNRHSDAIGRWFEINELILDHFKLTLDVNLDSSKLITGGFVALPLLTEELGKMRARGATLLNRGTESVDDKLAIIGSSQRAQERLKQADRLFQQAFLINPSLSGSLGDTLAEAKRQAAEAIVLAEEKLIRTETLDYSSKEYFSRFTVAIDAQFKVVDAMINNIKLTLSLQTAELRQRQIWLLASMAILALFAAWVGTMLTRSITVPMAQSVSMVQRVAAYDLTMQESVIGKDESAQLLDTLNVMTDSLGNIVSDVRASIDVIHVASKEIANGNTDLSNRTESQASSLEETASSMEQLTATVRQNADNARQANELVNSASGLALKGGDVVNNVVQTMGSIKQSSDRIVDIISVIDAIAFQTNILALNAAVEAARAGEQGRGFAVVASEVRTLAQRSASAAKEIKTLIGDSVKQVETGGRLVDEAGVTMGEIVTAVQHVAEIMGEITAASQEQSAGITAVNTAIVQIDVITQQNAALVEQAAAAAESLQEQADLLAHAVSVFKIAPLRKPGVLLSPVREKLVQLPVVQIAAI